MALRATPHFPDLGRQRLRREQVIRSEVTRSEVTSRLGFRTVSVSATDPSVALGDSSPQGGERLKVGRSPARHATLDSRISPLAPHPPVVYRQASSTVADG